MKAGSTSFVDAVPTLDSDVVPTSVSDVTTTSLSDVGTTYTNDIVPTFIRTVISSRRNNIGNTLDFNVVLASGVDVVST